MAFNVAKNAKYNCQIANYNVLFPLSFCKVQYGDGAVRMGNYLLF